MNDKRRKEIKGIINDLESYSYQEGKDYRADIRAFIERIESVESDEQNAFDNMSENLQAGRQDAFDEVMSDIEDAKTALEGADIDIEDGDTDFIEDAMSEAATALGNIQ